MASEGYFVALFSKRLFQNLRFLKNAKSAVDYKPAHGFAFAKALSPAKGFCTTAPVSPPGLRHNYSKEAETGVNRQISAELNASYAYLSMACFFGRSEVALPGCEGFFLKMHEEELGHARFFINYQNQRGGKVALAPIPEPKGQNDLEGVYQALAISLEMEKKVKEQLLALLKIAQSDGDEGLADILAGQFITDQDRSICEFGRLLTRAGKMACDGNGEFLFDREIYETFVAKGGKKEGYK